MRNRFNYMIGLFIFSLISCQSETTKNFPVNNVGNAENMPIINEPDFNYHVDAPQNWFMVDTVMGDAMRVKLIKAPFTLLVDSPFINIIIAHMNGHTIEDHTSRNISYLQTHMPGITILEKGNIDSSNYNGKWFTYKKEQNGHIRDAIDYIIPYNGFGYSITCSTSKGKMGKYRSLFDSIAKSFKE